MPGTSNTCRFAAMLGMIPRHGESFLSIWFDTFRKVSQRIRAKTSHTFGRAYLKVFAQNVQNLPTMIACDIQYEVFRTQSGDVAKTGISGQPLNQNGTSPRANSQVNSWNATEGESIYDARVVSNVADRRADAKAWEAQNAERLRNEGNSMDKHKVP